jgi:uncharacterized membrane protein
MTVERTISRILLLGGVLGIALMLTGLVAYAVRVGVGDDTLGPARLTTTSRAGGGVHAFTSIAEIRTSLRHRPLDPLAITAAGVLVLLATPVTATAAAAPVFLRRGDRRYAVIATVLTLVLVGSLLIGGG